MQRQQAGDLAGAVPEYREFLKLHPEATAIHTNLGVALAGLGKFEEAIPEYRAALRQSPSQPTIRLNLALAYYKMGQLSKAVTQLTRVHADAEQSSPPAPSPSPTDCEFIGLCMAMERGESDR